ncbi:MAG: UvrD-helicase domain-containing protein [Negativicutes bacterium]|nr:UvrD-helicase domain-containing protein [Negativicutes bacterium]
MKEHQAVEAGQRRFLQTAFGRHIAVAAGAGSGKTRVLVDRVVNRLKQVNRQTGEYFSLDNMAIMTFTDKAAQELRERIARAIAGERLRAEDRRLADHLEEQELLVDSAPISTIHSFCRRLISDHFHHLSIDPVFAVIDQNEQNLLLRDTLSDLLAEAYRPDHQLHGQVQLLADWFAEESSDRKLLDVIIGFYRNVARVADIEQFLSGAAELTWPAGARTYGDSVGLRQMLESEWRDIGLLFDRILALYDAAGNMFPGIAELAACRDRCRMEREQLAERLTVAIRNRDLEGLVREQARVELKRWAGKLSDRNFAATDFAGQYRMLRSVRDEARDLFSSKRGIQGITYRALRLNQDIRASMDAARTGIAALAEVTAHLHRRWREVKRRLGRLDFSDLEQMCVELLRDPDVGKEVAANFVDICVDEYQDTSPIQEEILSLFECYGSSTFVVGDVKQSIYRFRNAEPRIFQEKCRNYSPGYNSDCCLVNLNANFRSRREVVETVNGIFSQLMTGQEMEIDYRDNQHLDFAAGCYSHVPADAVNPLTELHIIDLGNRFSHIQVDGAGSDQEGGDISGGRDSDDDCDDWPDQEETGDDSHRDDDPDNLADIDDVKEAREIKKIEAEGLLIARMIREMVDSGRQIYDKHQERWRGITYSDIAVLMATRTHLRDLAVVMRGNGVPIATDRESYLGEWEVKLMLDILSVLDNPLQDIALAAVMHSPLFGFSLEEMLIFRQTADEHGYLWQQLEEISSRSGHGRITLSLSGRLADFVSRINHWRQLSQTLPLAELMEKIAFDSRLMALAAAQTGGSQRLRNLRMLIERARQFERSSRTGLFAFLRYLRQLENLRQEENEKAGCAGQADCVQFMTIHGSKGLEFPVVFLVYAAGQKNKRQTAEVLVDRRYGVGLKVMDCRRFCRHSPPIYQFLYEEAVRGDRAEYLRLLYVAMTRAREKLVITACVNLEKYKMPDPPEARSFFDWIAWAARRLGWQTVVSSVTAASGPPAGGGQSPPLAVAVHRRDEIVRSQLRGFAYKVSRETAGRAKVTRLAVDKGEVRACLAELAGKESMPAYVPPKVTVTGLSRWLAEVAEPEEEITPELSPAGPAADGSRPGQAEDRLAIGQAYHLVMQNLDLGRIGGLRQLEEELAGLVGRRALTPEQLALVDLQAVWGFVASSLGRRLAGAAQVFREQPFVHKVPAGELTGRPDDGQSVLLQGVIDLLFEESDGRLVLIDFKTDRDGCDGSLLARHSRQISLYARAVEAICRRPVAEKYIWHIPTARAVMVE